jgi:hypothetical protein
LRVTGPEAAQDSPNAQFHIQQPSEKLLARNQQRPALLRSHRFGVHVLELATATDGRKSA